MFRERYVTILIVVLLSALTLQVILIMKEKSVTADEMIFIKSGHQYLKTGNINIDDVNPPLIMIISALPLLFLNTTVETEIPPGVEELWFQLYSYSQNPDQILFWARVPMLLLSLMLALLVFRWARDFYGTKAGLLALSLYSFSPTIISLSGFATLDLGSTFFIFLALYLFWKFLKNPSLGRLVIMCLSVGLAFSSKHTSLMLIPSFILLSFIVVFKGNFNLPATWPFFKKYGKNHKIIFWGTSSGILIIILVLTVNIVCGFNGTGIPLGDLPFVEKEVFKSHPLFSRLINPYTDWIPIPLPYAYLRGIGSTIARTTMTHGFPSFLMGEISPDGWWYYFLFAFAVKTPIPFLIAILFSIVLIKKSKNINWCDELFLAIPIGVMFIMASRSNAQMGIRHILVVYPLLFVFASKLVQVDLKRKIITIICGIILGIWYVYASISVSPHYLSYFNEFVGGPKNGYRYLIDSNLDWGQDVKGLVKLMDRKGIDKIKFGHWIGIEPRYASRFEELGCEPTTGWVAIQVNSLQGLTEAWGVLSPDCYAWLRKLEPVDRAGYSIFVYYIPTKPLSL
ncbi:MAG: ArnT family glycosyltransferase [Candidatus Scalinduaceae bacterium]